MYAGPTGYPGLSKRGRVLFVHVSKYAETLTHHDKE